MKGKIAHALCMVLYVVPNDDDDDDDEQMENRERERERMRGLNMNNKMSKQIRKERRGR